MATKYIRKLCAWLAFILVSTFKTIPYVYIEGTQILDLNDFEPQPKGTAKTIEVPEDGDLIDCVDIYQQPSFDDPRNEDMQMEPSLSWRNVFTKRKTYPSKIIQNWHKYGECSKGTIPIRRNKKNTGLFHKKARGIDQHEYEVVKAKDINYHGAGASLNLWNPRVVASKELSLTQLWIVSGGGSYVNTIEVGWMVNPKEFGDSQTRLFIYWTKDTYNRTGCYNLRCPGFRQHNNRMSIGSPFPNMSVYGQKIEDIYIAVFRDKILGHWRLIIGDEEVGYWHRNIFSSLNYGAIFLDVGGEIVNQKEGGRHTATQMGSGHFSSEGILRASYVRDIQVVDANHDPVDLNLTLRATHPRCYDIQHGPPNTSFGTHFFYGGPGLSDQCVNV